MKNKGFGCPKTKFLGDFLVAVGQNQSNWYLFWYETNHPIVVQRLLEFSGYWGFDPHVFLVCGGFKVLLEVFFLFVFLMVWTGREPDKIEILSKEGNFRMIKDVIATHRRKTSI